MWRSIRLGDAIANDGQPRVWEYVFDPVTIPELDDYLALAAEEDGRDLEDIEFRITFHLWTEKEKKKGKKQDQSRLAVIVPEEYDLHIYLHEALVLGSHGLQELISDGRHELHHLARSESGRHAASTPCDETITKLRSIPEKVLESAFPPHLAMAIDYMSKGVEISAHAMEAAMWFSENAPELEPSDDFGTLTRGVFAVAKREELAEKPEPGNVSWASLFLTLAMPRWQEYQFSEIKPSGMRMLSKLDVNTEDISRCLKAISNVYVSKFNYYLKAARRNK
jgi:hypothetical protein